MAVQDVITRVRVRSIAARDTITRIRVTSTVTLTVSAGTGRALEPFDTVTLSASASQPPDSWLWEQTDGAAVTISGSGASRTFTAPATLNGTTLTFQVTAAKSGTTPAVAQVTYTVYPHTTWRGTANGDIAPVTVQVGS